MKSNYKRWEKEEIEKLKFLYHTKGLGSVEITPLMNRSKTSIHLKLKKLKIRHTREQTKLLKSRLIKVKKMECTVKQVRAKV